MSSDTSGQLFIVSAPSGTGKTTLVERIVQLVPDLTLSRSFTSRPPRAGECDGMDYNFITRELFERMIEDGEFLEWANVFGNYYGTSAAETDRILSAGHDLVLVIDVQGAQQVRARRADTIGIFVLPPCFAVLEDRLRRRSKDTEAQIQRRLEVARQEVGAVADYEYVVVNDELESAVGRLRAIVEAERARLRRMAPVAAGVIETFR
jgi:guanylate kinase